MELVGIICKGCEGPLGLVYPGRLRDTFWMQDRSTASSETCRHYIMTDTGRVQRHNPHGLPSLWNEGSLPIPRLQPLQPSPLLGLHAWACEGGGGDLAKVAGRHEIFRLAQINEMVRLG